MSHHESKSIPPPLLHDTTSSPTTAATTTTTQAVAAAAADEVLEDDSNDENSSDLPLTLSASVVLDSLPRDSRVALNNAFAADMSKVNVRFLAVGSAPSLVRRVFAITASKKFSIVVSFLRKKLGLKDFESVFVYVNSTFAPALDEEVGNLFKCFKVENELVVSYCMTPAFG